MADTPVPPAEESPNAVPDPQWSADISLKAKMTQDDAKFVFEQAEKLLKDSIDTGAQVLSPGQTQ